MTTSGYSMPNPISPELKALRTGFRFLSAVTPEIAGRVALTLFLTPKRHATKNKRGQIFEKAQNVPVRHGRRQLAAYVWGEGPAILLVHGWASDATRMRAFVGPLLRHGFRVIAFDAPAHGQSAGKQTNLIDFSGAIQSVIAQLGPVDGIVAHSFGAATTLLMLGRSPKIGVKCVVAVGSPADPSKMVDVWTSVLGLPQPIINQMVQRLEDRVGVPMNSLRVDTAVANLTIPGLVIHDKKDSIVPYSEGVAIAQEWQTAELVTTDGFDHRSALRDPKTIRDIRLFLASHIQMA
jgi:pimeloyl-ACP methyl ester carboxylesterase